MTDEVEGRCFRMRLIEYHNHKTLMGPCLISFSIPLLVPGVVLTVVGSYGNELTFPTYGGWHITGIVFLGLSVVMLIVGIFLKCFFRPIISADIEEHLSPAPSLITGKKNFGYIKDTDNAGMGNGTRTNKNKVAHLDPGGTHTLVSTHESKASSSQSVRAGDVPNGASGNITESSKHSRTKDYKRDKGVAMAARGTRNTVPEEDITVIKDDTDDASRHVDPPSYNEAVQKRKKKRRSSNSLQGVQGSTSADETTSVTKSGNVTTRVTTKVTARADTDVPPTQGSRDHSSDANENSQFLPEKKRKKKRRRRHRQSSELTAGESGETIDTARPELPDLRIKPALVHDNIHSHQNCHVHFDQEPGATMETAGNMDTRQGDLEDERDDDM